MPRIDWEGMAVHAGYSSEREMWERMYLKDEKSISEIAACFDMKQITVRNRLVKYGLPLRERGGTNNQYAQRRTLFRIDQRIALLRTFEHINAMTGISRVVIKIYRRRIIGEGENPNAVRSDQSDERLDALFETFKLPPTSPPSGEP